MRSRNRLSFCNPPGLVIIYNNRPVELVIIRATSDVCFAYKATILKLRYSFNHKYSSQNSLTLSRSYLSNKKQSVKIGKIQSDFKRVKPGLYMNLLGPLLFISYVNNMPLVILNSILDMYTNDSSMYATGSNIALIISLIQNDVNKVKQHLKIFPSFKLLYVLIATNPKF